MVDKITTNQKPSELRNKINEIIEALKTASPNPVGNIVSYPSDEKTIQDNSYVLCDFSHYSEDDYPIVYNKFIDKNTYTKMYGLRRHITGEGCILYTTNPDILKAPIADISELFRKDFNGLFVNIKEDISMSFGSVVSSSGFYDGTYTLNSNDSFYINKNMTFAQTKVLDYENYAPCVFEENTTISFPSNYKLLPYSTSTTVVGEQATASAIISDNYWLTHIVDGKQLLFAVTNPVDGVSVPSIIASETNEAAPMDISFDYITPATFTKSTNVFWGLNVFNLNIVDVNGTLSFYMARYNKDGNYRHSNVNTGVKLKPNTKYRIGLYHKETFMNGKTVNYRYNISAFQYNEDGTTYNSTVIKDNTNPNFNTYEFASAYCPYNYYNKVGLSYIYAAAAPKWSGGFLDLKSISIGGANSKYYYTYTANKVTTTVIESRNTYDKQLGENINLTASKGIYMPYIKTKNSSNTYIIAK